MHLDLRNNKSLTSTKGLQRSIRKFFEGGDVYVHYLDRGDGFTAMYMSKHQIVHLKYM